MAHMGGQQGFQRAHVRQPLPGGLPRPGHGGVGFGLRLGSGLCRRFRLFPPARAGGGAQGGQAVLMQCPFLPRLPQQGARGLHRGRLRAAGVQQGGKALPVRRINPGVLHVHGQPLAGQRAVALRHAQQVFHKDVRRLVRDAGQIRPLEQPDDRAPARPERHRPARAGGGLATRRFLKNHAPAAVLDTKAITEYFHDCAPIGLVYNVSFMESGSRFKPIGVYYLCQLVIIETVAVVILPQHKADHVFLSVKPDPVRKDMRHKAGLLFQRIKVNAGFHNLGNERHGTRQRFVKTVMQRVLYSLWRDGDRPPPVRIGDGGAITEIAFCPLLDAVPETLLCRGVHFFRDANRRQSLPLAEPVRAVRLDGPQGGKAFRKARLAPLRRKEGVGTGGKGRGAAGELVQRRIGLPELDKIGLGNYLVSSGVVGYGPPCEACGTIFVEGHTL